MRLMLPPYHGYGYREGYWLYGFNILAELDRPGVGCTFRNLENHAVTIYEGAENGVVGCDVYGTGGGGIFVDIGQLGKGESRGPFNRGIQDETVAGPFVCGNTESH
jgi:hypothetical protein